MLIINNVVTIMTTFPSSLAIGKLRWLEEAVYSPRLFLHYTTINITLELCCFLSHIYIGKEASPQYPADDLRVDGMDEAISSFGCLILIINTSKGLNRLRIIFDKT